MYRYIKIYMYTHMYIFIYTYREVFEEWNSRCGKFLQMGDYVTIDECLYSMRNKISFKQFNPNKPAKYGLLFKELNEVRIPYIHRSEIYSGRPEITEDNPASEFYNPTVEGVTLRLVDQVAKHQDVTGRNITMDNLYTSISLFDKLLDRKITAVGTLRSNRRGIPDEVKSIFQREDKSTLVYWESKKKYLFSHVVRCTYKVERSEKYSSSFNNANYYGKHSG